MRLLEKAKGPVAPGLEEGLPCSEIGVIGESVGRIVGCESVWERYGGYGSLWVV